MILLMLTKLMKILTIYSMMTLKKTYDHVDEAKKEIMEKSYIDDFDALLEDDNNKEFMNIDTDVGCNVDDDFDALLMAENIQIDSTKNVGILSDTKETNNKEKEREEDVKESKEKLNVLQIEDYKEKDLEDGVEEKGNTNEFLEKNDEEENIKSIINKQLEENP